MNIFKKVLFKWALLSAEKTDYTMQKILVLYNEAALALTKEWSESSYQKLMNVRDFSKLQDHWFEELWILLNEVKYLQEHHNDQKLFYAANERLLKLHEIFDLSNEDFKTKYEENYINGKISKIQEQTEECLLKFYDDFYNFADYMTAHMNYSAALLCGKAMGKIEVITGKIVLKDRMERLFKMAVDYGYIRQLDQAMDCYNEAARIAMEANDKTYEYIAIMRKLSICLGSEHMTNHIDLDAESLSSVVRLDEMCDGNHLNPYSLGEQLILAEQEKIKSCSKTEKEVINWRICRLREAMPILHLQLALSRGDWQTARVYAEELKEKEMLAYGSNSDFSNSDMMIPTYAMLYNSVERNEVSEQFAEEEVETSDEPYFMNFPKDMFPIDKHRYLIMTARNEMMQNHPLAAVSLSEQAAEIASEMNSDYHLAMAIHSIGQSYEFIGNITESLKYYRRVIKILREDVCLGSDVCLSNYLLFTTLFEIGNLVKDTEPDEAIRVLTETISLLNGKKNDETYFLENTLLVRAYAKSKIGDIAGKEEDCLEVLNLILKDAKRRLPFMDKEKRENYWAEVLKLLGKVVAQVDDTSSPSLILAVYEAILMAKGFLLSSEKAEKDAVFNEESLSEYIPLYKELEEYENSKLPWGTLSENSADKYVEHYMKSMKLLMATNSVIEKFYDFMHVKLGTIVNSLNDDEVVLDYYDYTLENGDQQYIAFVYRKGSDTPEFVKVCKESDLQTIYKEVAANQYEDGTPFHISEAYNPTWRYSIHLCNLIFKNVINNLGLSKESTIYFIPSGSLYKIPVESLVMIDDTDTTISDFYTNFIRISHVRSLLKKEDSKLDSIGLFGGLNYGTDSTNESSMRGYVIGMDDHTPTPLVPWSELKQTLSEVKNISFLWNLTKSIKADVYLGLDGTAEMFKKQTEKGCSILHLATHGFFETVNSKINIPGLKGSYKPMDLTGIVMSNGNEGWLRGNNMHHEGILTATDITRMDLSKTKLVVLSACYTGEGIIRSDGVFGLQRAFKKAGAKSLVMSLWNESDEVGSQFMSVFYSHLLTENIDPKKAFKLAKMEIRRRFPHPQFWANFIMID